MRLSIIVAVISWGEVNWHHQKVWSMVIDSWAFPVLKFWFCFGNLARSDCFVNWLFYLSNGFLVFGNPSCIFLEVLLVFVHWLQEIWHFFFWGRIDDIYFIPTNRVIKLVWLVFKRFARFFRRLNNQKNAVYLFFTMVVNFKIPRKKFTCIRQVLFNQQASFILLTNSGTGQQIIYDCPMISTCLTA